VARRVLAVPLGTFGLTCSGSAQSQPPRKLQASRHTTGINNASLPTHSTVRSRWQTSSLFPYQSKSVASTGGLPDVRGVVNKTVVPDKTNRR